MKVQHHGYGSRYDSTTPNGIEEARRNAPGEGMHLSRVRLCCRCAKEKPQKGGKWLAGAFLCEGCK